VAQLPRDSLVRTPARLDGRSVELLELPVDLGAMLGLEPGDVLRVESAPPASNGGP